MTEEHLFLLAGYIALALISATILIAVLLKAWEISDRMEQEEHDDNP